MNAQFDPIRLFAALDAAREQRGLTWSAMAKQIEVSAGTIKRLQTHDSFELDGILWLTQWIGLEPEDFLADGNSVAPKEPSQFRRFDPPALYAVVEAELSRRGWDEQRLAKHLGIPVHVINRLRKYRRFRVEEVLPVTQWLGRRLSKFTRVGPPPEQLH